MANFATFDTKAFIYMRGGFLIAFFFQVQQIESLKCTFLETVNVIVYIVSELKAWYCVAQKYETLTLE